MKLNLAFRGFLQSIKMNARELSDKHSMRVRKIFDSLATRYDLANTLISFGADARWRKNVAHEAAKLQPIHILDAACGTGKLLDELGKKLPEAEIFGVDFSPEMLEVARKRGLTKLCQADLRNMPFADESFDLVSIAFGLRNAKPWTRSLEEILRVLRAGGSLLILDFSLPKNKILRTAHNFYLKKILPLIACTITGNRAAYDYLAESIQTFPSDEEMLEFLREAGFQQAEAKTYTLGVCSLYIAKK